MTWLKQWKANVMKVIIIWKWKRKRKKSIIINERNGVMKKININSNINEKP